MTSSHLTDQQWLRYRPALMNYLEGGATLSDLYGKFYLPLRDDKKFSANIIVTGFLNDIWEMYDCITDRDVLLNSPSRIYLTEDQFRQRLSQSIFAFEAGDFDLLKLILFPPEVSD